MNTYLLRFALPSLFILFLCSHDSSFAQGHWSSASASGFTPRTYPSIAEVGGKIYIIGGTPSAVSPGAYGMVEVYNPAANTWSSPPVSGKFTSRSGASATVVGGKIYVIGGQDSVWTVLSTIEIFDPATNTWSTPTVTGTGTPRYRHVAALIGSKIYLIGGTGASSNYSVALEVFDTQTNSWSTPAVTGNFTKRRAGGVAVFDDKIYVIGGYNGQAALGTLEVFDPTVNEWQSPATTGVHEARYGSATVMSNNKFYMIGGYNLVQMLTQVDVYDPTTNEWEIEDATGTFTGRSGLVAAAVGGKIYAIGGSTLTAIATVHEVYTPSQTSSVEFGSSEFGAPYLSISPNPVQQLLTIPLLNLSVEHADCSVKVYNSVGACVLNTRSDSNEEILLDVSILSTGCYNLQLSSEGKMWNGLFVKE